MLTAQVLFWRNASISQMSSMVRQLIERDQLFFTPMLRRQLVHDAGGQREFTITELRTGVSAILQRLETHSLLWQHPGAIPWRILDKHPTKRPGELFAKEHGAVDKRDSHGEKSRAIMFLVTADDGPLLFAEDGAASGAAGSARAHDDEGDIDTDSSDGEQS